MYSKLLSILFLVYTFVGEGKINKIYFLININQYIISYCIHTNSSLKPDHKNKKPRYVAPIHGTIYFHIKFLQMSKWTSAAPSLSFLFNGQALHYFIIIIT
jgi:hypothetical protein